MLKLKLIQLKKALVICFDIAGSLWEGTCGMRSREYGTLGVRRIWVKGIDRHAKNVSFDGKSLVSSLTGELVIWSAHLLFGVIERVEMLVGSQELFVVFGLLHRNSSSLTATHESSLQGTILVNAGSKKGGRLLLDGRKVIARLQVWIEAAIARLAVQIFLRRRSTFTDRPRPCVSLLQVFTRKTVMITLAIHKVWAFLDSSVVIVNLGFFVERVCRLNLASFFHQFDDCHWSADFAEDYNAKKHDKAVELLVDQVEGKHAVDQSSWQEH